jgi:cytochrome subunit of sulfide dehydrogenase
MKRWIMALPAGFALAMAAFTPAAAMDAERVMADACSGCHGGGPGAMPSLSGKSAGELRSLLGEYRDGRREATVMDRIVRGYSEAQIDAIVAVYAGKDRARAP